MKLYFMIASDVKEKSRKALFLSLMLTSLKKCGRIALVLKGGKTMPGLGTVINTLAIIAGGLLGLLFGKAMNEKIKDSLCKACGVCVLFIGMAGAFEKILTVSDGKIVSGHSMLLIGAANIIAPPGVSTWGRCRWKKLRRILIRQSTQIWSLRFPTL